MKIIAKSEAGYICELTEEDIKALVGESRYGWSKEGIEKLRELGVQFERHYGSEIPKFIGAKIDLDGRFNRVLEIERERNRLKGTAQTLRDLAGLLDGVGKDVLILPK